MNGKGFETHIFKYKKFNNVYASWIMTPDCKNIRNPFLDIFRVFRGHRRNLSATLHL